MDFVALHRSLTNSGHDHCHLARAFEPKQVRLLHTWAGGRREGLTSDRKRTVGYAHMNQHTHTHTRARARARTVCMCVVKGTHVAGADKLLSERLAEVLRLLALCRVHSLVIQRKMGADHIGPAARKTNSHSSSSRGPHGHVRPIVLKGHPTPHAKDAYTQTQTHARAHSCEPELCEKGL